MSSQTVYFTNPTVISNLQSTTTAQASQISSMSGAITYLQGAAGLYGISQFPPIQNNLSMNTYLKTLPRTTVAAAGTGSQIGTNTTDARGYAMLGGNFAFGNAFNGQEFWVQTGAISALNGTGTAGNAARDQLDENWSYYSGSLMKTLAGLTFTRLLQEGYFTLADTITSYVSSWSGTGYYIVDATGTLGAAGFTGPDFSSWTGTIAPFSLSSLTMAHALGMQIPGPYPLDQLGQYQRNWQIANYASTTTNEQVDWRYCYAKYLQQKCYQLGGLLGPTGALALNPAVGSFTGALRFPGYNAFYGNDHASVTGPYTDFVNLSIASIRSGAAPLSFMPGEITENKLGISNDTVQYNQFSWCLLAAACWRAIQTKNSSIEPTYTFTSLTDYCRKKIMEPLGMTTSNSLLTWSEPATNMTSKLQSTTWRRVYANCTGYYSYQHLAYNGQTVVDPQYLIDYPSANAAVHYENYKNDGMWRYFGTGPWTGYNPNEKLINPASDGIFPLKGLANMAKCIALKGTINGQQVLSRTSFNWFWNAYQFIPGGIQDTLGPNNSITNQIRGMGISRYVDPFSFLIYRSAQTGPNGLGVGAFSDTFPQSDGFATFNGSAGVQWACDIESGNWACYHHAQSAIETTVNTPATINMMQKMSNYI